MASIDNTLGIVLAGGRGARLHSLTQARCKPAVPFNGKHRLVDFVLSNLLNSGLSSVQLLVQYQTQSLVEHIQQAWTAASHLLPRLVKRHRLMAYDFAENQVPGTHAYEEPAYWRDVGTVDAYFEAHLDTLGVRPRFRMTNPQWPIYGAQDASESAQIEAGQIHRSVVGSGCLVDGARLDHATLRRAVHLQPGAALDHCIVMDRCVVGAGASLRRVIVDQDNHIPPGERIGHDEAFDRMRFHVSPGGVVLVPRGHFRRPA